MENVLLKRDRILSGNEIDHFLLSRLATKQTKTNELITLGLNKVWKSEM